MYEKNCYLGGSNRLDPIEAKVYLWQVTFEIGCARLWCLFILTFKLISGNFFGYDDVEDAE